MGFLLDLKIALAAKMVPRANIIFFFINKNNKKKKKKAHIIVLQLPKSTIFCAKKITNVSKYVLDVKL